MATFAAFKAAFEALFKSLDMLKYKSAREIFTGKQGTQESADEFIKRIENWQKQSERRTK